MNVSQRSESYSPLRRNSRKADAQSSLFTIGDLAKAFNVSLRTLRFYEDRGLITPHREGTARYYSEHDKSRIALILKGKHLGFTLGEIRDMLKTQRTAKQDPDELALDPEQIAAQIHHLERQRSEIDGAIAELRAAHRQFGSSS